MTPEDLIIEGQRQAIKESFKKEKRLVVLEEMSKELEQMIEQSDIDEQTKGILEFMHAMIKKAYQDE